VPAGRVEKTSQRNAGKTLCSRRNQGVSVTRQLDLTNYQRWIGRRNVNDRREHQLRAKNGKSGGTWSWSWRSGSPGRTATDVACGLESTHFRNAAKIICKNAQTP